MIPSGPATRVFVALEPVDMRKGDDGLYGLVTHQLGEDPRSGHLFVFTNSQRNRLKILYWDGSEEVASEANVSQEDKDAVTNNSPANSPAKPPPKQPVRAPLPAHLPREERIIHVAAKDCLCPQCGGQKSSSATRRANDSPSNPSSCM